MADKLKLLTHIVSSHLKGEAGAVAFEYVLIVGGVGAAVVGAIVFANPTLVDVTILGACQAIGSVLGNAESCLS